MVWGDTDVSESPQERRKRVCLSVHGSYGWTGRENPWGQEETFGDGRILNGSSLTKVG